MHKRAVLAQLNRGAHYPARMRRGKVIGRVVVVVVVVVVVDTKIAKSGDVRT